MKISFLGFILSILVIYAHSYNTELFMIPSKNILYSIENILASKVAQTAVPGFFMISSYLFFRNINIKVLAHKLLRRFYSILIPYMLWNFIYYIGYFIASHIPYVSEIVGKGIISFNINGLIFAIFLHKYNYVFWFILQLILLIIISPILYFILKNKYLSVIGLIFIIFLLHTGINLKFINTDALFYYYTAGLFSMYFSQITEKNYSLKLSSAGIIPAALGIFIYRLTFYTNNTAFIVYSRFLFIVAIWLLLNEEIIKSPILYKYKKYFSNTFLVYATHLAIVRMINKSFAILFPNNSLVATILFLSMPILIFAIVTPIAFFIRKYMPIFYDLISGRR